MYPIFTVVARLGCAASRWAGRARATVGGVAGPPLRRHDLCQIPLRGYTPNRRHAIEEGMVSRTRRLRSRPPSYQREPHLTGPPGVDIRGGTIHVALAAFDSQPSIGLVPATATGAVTSCVAWHFVGVRASSSSREAASVKGRMS